MSGLCDRCNEKTSHLVNIAHLPELDSVAHLGYRQVCSPCYDDLVAEASDAEEREEDRRVEPRVKVSIKARVEGNTAHLEPFSDEMVIDEISRSGLRLRTTRDLDSGAILRVQILEDGFEAATIVEAVWRESGERNVGLKLVEPSDGWDRLYNRHAPEE
jgi:PilZ domain-containing protein